MPPTFGMGAKTYRTHRNVRRISMTQKSWMKSGRPLHGKTRRSSENATLLEKLRATDRRRGGKRIENQLGDNDQTANGYTERLGGRQFRTNEGRNVGTEGDCSIGKREDKAENYRKFIVPTRIDTMRNASRQLALRRRSMKSGKPLGGQTGCGSGRRQGLRTNGRSCADMAGNWRLARLLYFLRTSDKRKRAPETPTPHGIEPPSPRAQDLTGRAPCTAEPPRRGPA